MRPDEVDPEVTDCGRFGSGKASKERDGDGNPHRRGEEVVRDESNGLGRVAHRRFTRVALPVCIRRETDGRVEGKPRRNPWKVRWVVRKVGLRAEDHVGDQLGDQRKAEHREGVLFPRVLTLWVDAGESHHEPFDRPDDAPVDARFASEDARHVVPEGDGQGSQQPKENQHQNDSRRTMGQNLSGLANT